METSSYYVMDACALIAFLRDEQGADEVEEILVNTAHACIAHAVNLIEVYKHFLKYESELDAEEAIKTLTEKSGITARHDMDLAFWKSVSKWWATISTTISHPTTGRCHSITLADCFAVALARRTDGTAVTCDSDFQYVSDASICKVAFFRPPGTRNVYTK